MLFTSVSSYIEAQSSIVEVFPLKFPLFTRGYEVGGPLQRPNAGIVCSSGNYITQTSLSHHILLYLVDLKVRYALPNNLC